MLGFISVNDVCDQSGRTVNGPQPAPKKQTRCVRRVPHAMPALRQDRHDTDRADALTEGVVGYLTVDEVGGSPMTCTRFPRASCDRRTTGHEAAEGVSETSAAARRCFKQRPSPEVTVGGLRSGSRHAHDPATPGAADPPRP
jgi:hypothetical protein